MQPEQDAHSKKRFRMQLARIAQIPLQDVETSSDLVLNGELIVEDAGHSLYLSRGTMCLHSPSVDAHTDPLHFSYPLSYSNPLEPSLNVHGVCIETLEKLEALYWRNRPEKGSSTLLNLVLSRHAPQVSNNTFHNVRNNLRLQICSHYLDFMDG